MRPENLSGGTSVTPDPPKIVIADSLPESAADLLRQMGWKVDARAKRSREKLLRDWLDRARQYPGGR